MRVIIRILHSEPNAIKMVETAILIEFFDRAPVHIEQIQTFLDLVETRSFGLTGERLGITQSTVSARISALERSLGSTLFYRGRGGTSPTPAGRRFEEHARSMTASWGLARQE